jgi:hypothetical protein
LLSYLMYPILLPLFETELPLEAEPLPPLETERERPSQKLLLLPPVEAEPLPAFAPLETERERPQKS